MVSKVIGFGDKTDYECRECGKLCGTFSHDSDPTHNDKSITRQCCSFAHVTGEMVKLARDFKIAIGRGSITAPMPLAMFLANIILETQKKEGK